MCEPYHSIVQLPDDDGTGGPAVKTGLVRLGLHKAGKWVKNIGRWLHVSKMGAGHHGALEKVSPIQAYQIEHVDYEAAWWDRTFKVDSWTSRLADTTDTEAFEAAREYADRVSLGNLSALRRFLEESFAKTELFDTLVHAFGRLLNRSGQRKLTNGLRGMFGRRNTEKREEVARYCLGFTRKRSLLVPEWADDNSLWTPRKDGS